MNYTKWAGGVALFVYGLAGVPAGAETLELPAGTQLHIVLETRITTKDSKSGDAFRARLVMPVFANEREVLPIGSTVEGTIVNLKGPGRVKTAAEMQLRPERLVLPDGRDLTISASVTEAQTGDDTKVDAREGTIKGPGKEGTDVQKVGTTAATSAVMGGIMYGGTGAAIGAGAVGAIALLHQIFKRGKDADLPPGTEIVLELNRPVSLATMEEVPPASQPETRESEPFVVPSRY